MFIVLQDQAFGFFEEVVAGSCRVRRDRSRSRPGSEVAAQGKHGIHQQRGAVFGPSLRLGRRFAQEKVAVEQALGQGGEVGVVPREIHVDEVHYQLVVVGDFGP